jgi:RND family efflux transporter MFP subunit
MYNRLANIMKSWVWVCIIFGLLFGVGIWLWIGQTKSSGAETETKEEPTAEVQVAAVTRKQIAETEIAYGNVVSQPGKIQSISVPFEVRARHVYVASGQGLHPGELLLDIEPSPSTQLQFRQAQNAVDAAHRDLAETESKFSLKLATNSELSQARKASRDADLQLQSFVDAGVESLHEIRCDKTQEAELVDKVNVQDGQIIGAGSPLIDLIHADDIEVKLGIRPESIDRMKPGQPVVLVPLGSDSENQLNGTIRMVTHRVDPATQLVDVFVSVHSGTKLLIDGHVQASVQTAALETLVVPKSAVLPKGSDFSLFTIADGKAKEQVVKIGLATASEVEIAGNDIKEGDQVVTVGNYELKDGSPVEIQKAEVEIQKAE